MCFCRISTRKVCEPQVDLSWYFPCNISASLHGWHSLWRCYKCCSHPGAHVTGFGSPPSQFSWLWYLNIPMDCKKLKRTWKMDFWDPKPSSMFLSTFLNAMQIQSEIKVLPILMFFNFSVKLLYEQKRSWQLQFDVKKREKTSTKFDFLRQIAMSYVTKEFSREKRLFQ